MSLEQSKLEKKKAKQLVTDRERRTNLKSKRRRNLFKKAIELSQMCEMQILILVHDTDLDKIFQYNSGQPEGKLFSVDEAISEYRRLAEISGKVKSFTDNDYKELKIEYNRKTGNVPSKLCLDDMVKTQLDLEEEVQSMKRQKMSPIDSSDDQRKLELNLAGDLSSSNYIPNKPLSV